MRLFAATLLASTIIELLGGAESWARKTTSRPNVIIMVADDLGYADLAFLDHSSADVKKLGTPNLDRIAAMGTYFANAYATSPICSPSRCGLITGSYQQRWGNYWYGQGGLPEGRATIPLVLRKLGYRNVNIGKTHLNGGAAQHPLDHGFDEFLGFIHHTWDYVRLSQKDVDAYKRRAKGKSLGLLKVGPLMKDRDQEVSLEDAFTTKVFTDRAIEVIEETNDDQPFYIELEYNAVHQPTYVTSPVWSRKVGLDVPVWQREAPDTWTFPYWDPQKSSWNAWHKRWGHLGEIDPLGRRRYLSHLIAMDHHIGRILGALEKSDKINDTLLVFLSDNGGTINTYANNTPLRGWKYMFGEGGIRIPMIIAYAGRLPKGQRKTGLVSAMDVMPTVIELAGGVAPKGLDGRSLLPLISGSKDFDNHEYLCWAKGGNKGARVIRKGPWKLTRDSGWEHSNFKIIDGKAIRDPKPVTYPGGVALFDLGKDIGERNNVADKNPEIVEQLTTLFDNWRGKLANPRRAKKK